MTEELTVRQALPEPPLGARPSLRAGQFLDLHAAVTRSPPRARRLAPLAAGHRAPEAPCTLAAASPALPPGAHVLGGEGRGAQEGGREWVALGSLPGPQSLTSSPNVSSTTGRHGTVSPCRGGGLGPLLRSHENRGHGACSCQTPGEPGATRELQSRRNVGFRKFLFSLVFPYINFTTCNLYVSLCTLCLI